MKLEKNDGMHCAFTCDARPLKLQMKDGTVRLMTMDGTLVDTCLCVRSLFGYGVPARRYSWGAPARSYCVRAAYDCVAAFILNSRVCPL